MIVATLLSDVLPDKVAAAEMYDDPPDLAPLPEEEPLIAKSVAKRRNEFITVRYCARQALGELGVPPVPILKGEKGEPCWPDGVVGSLTHCDGYRGAAVGRHESVRSVGIDADRFQRAGVDQSAHDGVADLGVIGKLSDRALPAFEPGKRLLSLRGQAIGDDAGRAVFDQLTRALQCRRGGQYHPQHRGQWAEVIVRRPLAQPPQRRGNRADIEDAVERAQAVVAHFLGLQAIGLPGNPEQLPWAQWRDDDGARLDVHLGRHAVIERAECCVECDDPGARETHRGRKFTKLTVIHARDRAPARRSMSG